MRVSTKEKRVRVLKTNIPLWNRWRKMFDVSPDLQNTDLQGADLQYADLRYANLRWADLQYADLRWADLRNAKLQYADLRYTSLDYSSGIPLWCGGQKAKIDNKQAMQIVAHAFAQDCDDEEYLELREKVRAFCEKSHIAKHLEWLREVEK